MSLVLRAKKVHAGTSGAFEITDERVTPVAWMSPTLRRSNKPLSGSVRSMSSSIMPALPLKTS